MRPTDIECFAVPGRPALHGELLLAGVSRPDLAADAYLGGLRRIDLTGGERAWTHGERDLAPAISPDGRWVAFLRATGDQGVLARPQVHVMPVDGGEARRLTALHLGAGAPVWAPDSRRLAFTARVPEPGRYGTTGPDGDSVEPAAEAPRRITRLDYRRDDIGFTRDRPLRLFVLDAHEPVTASDETDPLGGLVPLTDDRADVHDPAWTPDGTELIVSAAREWNREETQNTDLYAVPAAGGEPRLVVRSAGDANLPVLTEDGTLYFLGTSFPLQRSEARNTTLWCAGRLPAEGLAQARPLTDAETVDCESSAGPPVPLGSEVLVAVRNRGAVDLLAVPREAEGARLASLRRISAEHTVVSGFAAEGSTVIAVVADQRSAGDLVRFPADGDGTGTALTDLSAPLRERGVHPVEELNATSSDGYPVHGWLVRPEGEGPHPVLLLVHGGPFSAHEWGLFDEPQMYASAGYAVVLPNPRGSAGYGESHGRAVVGAMATVDAEDVLALLDEALLRPELDPGRVGAMGGSYGGFMTGWLSAHHGHRFRAAWSERAVNAWDSFSGSSDVGWLFTDSYIGNDPAEQHRVSPLSYAEKITIPFAVVHSEEDWRCPLEQAERMFVALRRAGTETEMLIFPGEGHELSRSGRPRHRRQRFDAVLEWWSRHLKG